MRVLIFHGYLLRGTGSNIYNASLAPALRGLGHDVHLLCQERDAATLPWVDRVGRWEGGELRIEELREPPGGSVSVYVPEIDDLLPVYVRDNYAGFRVKLFSELSDPELERYIAANVAAVKEVAAAAGGVDAALANHLVMGPLILSRAGLGCGFAAKIHGSALEYTVKSNPRFLPHAREGMAAATGVLVGSAHTARSLWETIADPSLPAKTRLGPPGVDTKLFAPGPRVLSPKKTAPCGIGIPRAPFFSAPPAAESAWARDQTAADTAIQSWLEGEQCVVYVGKLIVSKGVDLLLAAWPLVHEAFPNARLLIAGFGEYREGLERLWTALAAGDLGAARQIAHRGRALEGGNEGELRLLASFLAEPPAVYVEAAAAAADSVSFCGRLEHEEVAGLVPSADALVVPSTFPESFGMVAVEAAATGVLPVSADHSGLREVAQELASRLPPETSGLVSFALDEGAVAAIADRLNSWLSLPASKREESSRALAATVRELWSWERVACDVLAASEGRLDELQTVSSDERSTHRMPRE